MLKAGALNLVIIVALVVAVLCSALIIAAYFYQQQYQSSFRMMKLQDNLGSGINILLQKPELNDQDQSFSLFGLQDDSVRLHQERWGLYTLGRVSAFIGRDTVSTVFSMGHQHDPKTWAALYIIDEDRNISVSGKAVIRGDAYLPKAGIKEVYVNNMAYEGDKRLVIGDKKVSERQLPKLKENWLKDLWPTSDKRDPTSSFPDSLKNSFKQPARILYLGNKISTISGVMTGHLMIRSDTLIRISAKANLQDVVIFAKQIEVEEGFKGHCQLIASDSLFVGPNCILTYPSVLAVVALTDNANGQRKLNVGENSQIQGVVLCYEEAKNELRPVIDLGKNVKISGELYSSGLLNYKDGVVINGSTSVNRFLYQTAYTRYENYLINIRLDGPALFKDHLTSGLLPYAGTSQRILQWLK